jgi:hypothetical protein
MSVATAVAPFTGSPYHDGYGLAITRPIRSNNYDTLGSKRGLQV